MKNRFIVPSMIIGACILATPVITRLLETDSASKPYVVTGGTQTSLVKGETVYRNVPSGISAIGGQDRTWELWIK